MTQWAGYRHGFILFYLQQIQIYLYNYIHFFTIASPYPVHTDFIVPKHKPEHTQAMPQKFFLDFLAWLIPVCDMLIPNTHYPSSWPRPSHWLLCHSVSAGVCLQVLETSSTPSVKPAGITLLYVAPPFLCWYSHSSSCICGGMWKLWDIVLGHNIMNL